MTEHPRSCLSCGATNLAERELCAACGADLSTGEVPPRPVRREAPDPPDHRSEPARHARWIVPLVAAVAVVALLVVGLTVAGLGPFVRGEVPDATFDRSRYAGETSVLRLSDIATRTSASEDDPAVLMADGDPATAWRSAVTSADLDEGLGETIDLFLAEPAWIDRLLLRNGAQSDGEAYARSARLRRVSVIFDGGESVLADLLDLGLKEQQLILPEPMLTRVVRIDVVDGFSGETDELTVAEIGLVGWPAAGEDVELAEARQRARPATEPVAGRLPQGGL